MLFDVAREAPTGKEFGSERVWIGKSFADECDDILLAAQVVAEAFAHVAPGEDRSVSEAMYLRND